MNLTDKICIITGGASGIGLDIARTFAKAASGSTHQDTGKFNHEQR